MRNVEDCILKWYLPIEQITQFPGHSGSSSSQVSLQLVDCPFFKGLVVQRHQKPSFGIANSTWFSLAGLLSTFPSSQRTATRDEVLGSLTASSAMYQTYHKGPARSKCKKTFLHIGQQWRSEKKTESFAVSFFSDPGESRFFWPPGWVHAKRGDWSLRFQNKSSRWEECTACMACLGHAFSTHAMPRQVTACLIWQKTYWSHTFPYARATPVFELKNMTKILYIGDSKLRDNYVVCGGITKQAWLALNLITNNYLWSCSVYAGVWRIIESQQFHVMSLTILEIFYTCELKFPLECSAPIWSCSKSKLHGYYYHYYNVLMGGGEHLSARYENYATDATVWCVFGGLWWMTGNADVLRY